MSAELKHVKPETIVEVNENVEHLAQICLTNDILREIDVAYLSSLVAGATYTANEQSVLVSVQAILIKLVRNIEGQ